ncbi:hypothetical protein [Escherichia coli]|uniref:hypothetical protein n=1 Tax=Escherichia coli TaxID=562 RepID=UPI00351C03A5
MQLHIPYPSKFRVITRWRFVSVNDAFDWIAVSDAHLLTRCRFTLLLIVENTDNSVLVITVSHGDGQH